MTDRRAARPPRPVPDATVSGLAAPRASEAYFPRLDGLRAVAVLLVFWEHFTFNELLRSFSPGTIGVKMFFVLSGFLITSILLRTKAEGVSPGAAAVRFYWRRTLRLAPAFYVAIALAALLGIGDMREHWWLHAAYLSNVLVATEHEWVGGGHFWTLATEEQFYLLWFPVVILLPWRHIPLAILAGLVIAPLFRSLIVGGASPFIDVLLPAQIDSLATGALLGWMRIRQTMPGLERLLSARLMLGASVALVALMALPTEIPEVPDRLLFPVAINLAAACAIWQAIDPRPDPILDLLARPMMRKIGRISYGLYIYHYFLPQLTSAFVPPLADPESAALKVLRVIVWVAGSFLIATLSWRLVERPFLRLKDSPRRPLPSGAGD